MTHENYMKSHISVSINKVLKTATSINILPVVIFCYMADLSGYNREFMACKA